MGIVLIFSFPGRDRILSVLLAILFFVMLWLTRWLRRQWLATRARHWPQTRAMVNSAWQLDQGFRSSPRWATSIQYSYRVKGEFYSGEYFLPCLRSSSEDAFQEGQSWINRPITIRYNPVHPQASCFLVP